MNQVHVRQFAEGTLKFVQLASFTAKRACDELVVHRSMQKKASDLAPEVLELMVKTGAVQPDQRDAAAAMLGSHAETLNLLKYAVEELHKARTGEKQAGDLGRAENDPDAPPPGSYDSLNDCVVGRQTSLKKASDLAMLKVLEDPHA